MIQTDDSQMRAILEHTKTIAVVGISDKPDRESFQVAEYLKKQGYRILPVNPTVEQVLGEKSFASLRDIHEHVDVVDVFRKPQAVPEVVDDAIAIGAPVIWMQLGVVNEPAAQKARDAGLQVVMDHCMMREHKRLIGQGATNDDTMR